MALIRSEDFGPFKNYTKVWFTCDDCNIGVLQLYKTYLKQKNKKLCRACRNSYSQSFPDVKEKKSNRLKKQWADDEYRKSMSISLSKGCKETWDRDDGSRRKLISEITSQSLKDKWQTEGFRNNQVIKQKEAWSNETLKSNASKISKDLWENPEHRKKQMDSREKWRGEPAHNRHTYDIVRNNIQQEGYFLISKKYSDAHTKLIIRCNKGHLYDSHYNGFQQGHRCPECMKSFQVSRGEKEVLEVIKNMNIDVLENNRTLINSELDIVIPSKKIAIEYCGLYWHSELQGKNQNYHLKKLEKCESIGMRLITIFEDEWLVKKDIIEKRLKHILGLSQNNIGARKCEIQEIEGIQAKPFVNLYHIQGNLPSLIKLGAFYNSELVSVMTFSKLSISKGSISQPDIYEISRFCSNVPVVGIAGKFISYFTKTYKPKHIITFADRRWDTGEVYEKIGFKKIGYTKPNYWYFQTNTKKYHRFNFRKNVLDKKLEIFDPEKSEWENMKNNGWDRIWDCGNIKFIYTAN